ncbi:MAG: hypothetical protein IKX56_09300, partial [Muribaculaceae bacterium]|nr:hypothetical protein [Muribaculaceae bacterium]
LEPATRLRSKILRALGENYSNVEASVKAKAVYLHKGIGFAALNPAQQQAGVFGVRSIIE